MQIERLFVDGISCAGWARELQQALKSLNGVNDVKVMLGSGEAEVRFDEKLTTFDDLKIGLMQHGYTFSTSLPYPFF
jgi:copper chaperone